MSDSSDDDVPIAELLRRKEAAKEKTSKSPVIKTESKSNKPVVVTKKRSSSAVIEQKKDNSDSDDDDVPIAELLRRKTEKEKTKLSKPPQKIAKTDPISTSSKKSTYKNGSASRSVNFSNEFYSDTLKGKLVQKLLVRWWYAMSWPNESSFKDVPQGFEPLNGFPGVFVSTRVCVFLKIHYYC